MTSFVLSCPVPSCPVPSRPVLSLSRPVPSCPVLSRPVLSCPVLSCPVLSCPVLSCPVLSCPVLSCPVLSCPVLSCPVLSCPVLSCPVLSCPVLSCPVLSRIPLKPAWINMNLPSNQQSSIEDLNSFAWILLTLLCSSAPALAIPNTVDRSIGIDGKSEDPLGLLATFRPGRGALETVLEVIQ